MAVHYRTQGIILKKTDRREADQLFTIYTKNFGKLDILGKAIRKIKSKLRTGAELFYFSEMEFIQGKTYKILTDAILIDKFKNLREDLNKLKIAYKISEVFDNLVKGEEPDEELWQLILETFEKVNNVQPPTYQSGLAYKEARWRADNLSLLYYYFLWNLFSILGYQPELYSCVFCRKKLVPEKNFFSLQEGGIICNQCKKNKTSVVEIPLEIIKILRIILRKNLSLLLKLKIEKPYLKFLNTITKEYYLYISQGL